MGSKPSDSQSLVPKSALVVDLGRDESLTLEANARLNLALRSKDFEIGKTDQIRFSK